MRKHVEVHLTPEKEKYHLLETAPTNATDQDKKGFAQEKRNINNKSIIVQNAKNNVLLM